MFSRGFRFPEWFLLAFFATFLIEGTLCGMLALCHAFLFLLFWDEEVKGIGIGVDFDAIGDEGSGGNTQTFDDVVLEGAVMDGAGATRRASILKDGDLDSEEVAEAHGFLRAFDEVLGDVFSRFGKDGVIHHLARFSLLRESAFDLRAERNDFVMLFEPL